ncbi:MAG: PA14 domain-containing protein [Caldilineaceae bacterium]
MRLSLRLSFVLPVLAALLLGLWGAMVPASSATAAPAAQAAPPAAVGRFNNVNIYSGPGTSYPVIGTIPYGLRCTVLGRDTVTGWWLVQCPTGVAGWIAYDSVNIVGDSSLVPLFIAGSVPAAAPQSAPTDSWRATYYANMDLLGSPVLVQNVPDINFNWGLGSPGPSVPADHFSARYERTLPLAPGSYLLTLRMDDGARLYVDDQLVLDDWRAGPVRELSAVRTVGSSPRLRIDYFEENGEASISFAMTPMSDLPPILPTPSAPWSLPVPDLPVVQDQWRVQFFNNTDLGGSPAAAMYQPRGVYPLDMNWGSGAPASGIGVDFWSARYEGRFHFAPGNYDFFAVSDDGVRVYIDDILLINSWFDGHNDRSNRFDKVGTGWHTMRVEYYERTGNANLRVWWSLAGSRQPVTGPIPPPPTP